jgi:hypothetical protein
LVFGETIHARSSFEVSRFIGVGYTGLDQTSMGTAMNRLTTNAAV